MRNPSHTNKTRFRDLDRGILAKVGALTLAAVGLLAGGCDDDGNNRVTKEGAERVANSGLAVSAEASIPPYLAFQR